MKQPRRSTTLFQREEKSDFSDLNGLDSACQHLLNLAPKDEEPLYDLNGQVVRVVTGKERQAAFFTILRLNGFLTAEVLKPALNRLKTIKSFTTTTHKKVDVGTILRALSSDKPIDQLLRKCRQLNLCEADWLCILTYLSQSAFGRQTGQERNVVSGSSLFTYKDAATAAFASLGLTSPHPYIRGSHLAPHVIVVPGASYPRTEKRLALLKSYREYLSNAGKEPPKIWFTGGLRPLQEELDGADAMRDVLIQELQQCYSHAFLEDNLTKNNDPNSKKTTWQYRFNSANGVIDVVPSEEMLSRYLLTTLFPDSDIAEIYSSAESQHWRATTLSNATDVASKLRELYESKSLTFPCVVTLIAEQPFSQRMRYEFQKTINDQFRSLPADQRPNIQVQVIGEGLECSSGLGDSHLGSCNSDGAATWWAHCPQSKLNRDPKALTFRTRENFFATLKLAASTKQSTQGLFKPRVTTGTSVSDQEMKESAFGQGSNTAKKFIVTQP